MEIYVALFLFLFIGYLNGHSLKANDLKKQQVQVPSNINIAQNGEVVVPDVTEAEDNINHHYLQGDLLTTPDQRVLLDHLLDDGSRIHADPVSEMHADQAYSRGLIKSLRRTWDGGIIHYTIDKKIGKWKRGVLKKALKYWSSKTCLKFKERTNEEDYIHFVKSDNRCASYVGRIGGKQALLSGNEEQCTFGNIIHELGHSIGFFHEQSRPDRDHYVKVEWKNIVKGRERNFRKLPYSVIDSRGSRYDYDSVMHYSPKAFARNYRRKFTLIPRKDTDADVGQRDHLSEQDILQTNKLYHCNIKHRY